MKKVDEAKILKMVKGTDIVLVASENGTSVIGGYLDVLNLVANLAKNFKECGIDKDDIINAIELGYSSKKDLNKRLKEAITNLFNFDDEDEDE